MKFSFKCKAGSLGSSTCKEALLPLSHWSNAGQQDFGGPPIPQAFVEAGPLWQKDGTSQLTTDSCEWEYCSFGFCNLYDFLRLSDLTKPVMWLFQE